MSREDRDAHAASVLVVAKPDRMRDSLQLVLRRMARMDVVGQVDDIPSALEIVGERRPDLVLLDTNLPSGQAWALLRAIRTRDVPTQCLVLAYDFRQQETATSKGADAVLLKGFSTAELLATVEDLLPLEVPASDPWIGQQG